MWSTYLPISFMKENDSTAIGTSVKIMIGLNNVFDYGILFYCLETIDRQSEISSDDLINRKNVDI